MAPSARSETALSVSGSITLKAPPSSPAGGAGGCGGVGSSGRSEGGTLGGVSGRSALRTKSTQSLPEVFGGLAKSTTSPPAIWPISISGPPLRGSNQ